LRCCIDIASFKRVGDGEEIWMALNLTHEPRRWEVQGRSPRGADEGVTVKGA
jgi:hypothetical protein